jgi:hypothetical protein
MSAKNDSNKKDSPTNMDGVARPGKTPVDSTSRPVIVGHKPLLKQDPMVASSEDLEISSKAKEEPKSAPSSSGHTIEPLPESKTEEEVPQEKEVQDGAASKESEAEDKSDDTPAESSNAAVDALAGEVSAKREAEKASDEDVKKQLGLEAVIASHKYFVPIGEVSKKRAMNRILLGLIVLVLLAGTAADLAIDAGLIDIGVESLTDIL